MTAGPLTPGAATESPAAPSVPGAVPAPSAPGAVAAPVDAGALARVVARAVDASPVVARREAGPFGVASTPALDGRIEGIVIDDEAIALHVTLRWVSNLITAAEIVRDAALPWADGRAVDVYVEDIESPRRPA